MALRGTLLLLLTASLVGCADSALTMDRSGPVDEDDATETDGDQPDDVAYLGPHFFRIDGHLEVVGGVPVPEAATLTLTWYGQDGKVYNDNTPSCMPDVLEAVPGPSADLDLSAVFTWWQLSLAPTESDPCPWILEPPIAVGDTEVEQIVLGFGQFDPRLTPALEASGAQGAVYGLYGLLPGTRGDRLVTFGGAGTHEQWNGTDDPVEAAPLPDGRYEVRTLLLLPVAEAGR